MSWLERGQREHRMRGRQSKSACQVERDGEWEAHSSLIDDSDSVSWQMLLDRVDIMWVVSIWLSPRQREDVLEEGEEQTDTQTQGNTTGRLKTCGLTKTYRVHYVLKVKKDLLWYLFDLPVPIISEKMYQICTITTVLMYNFDTAASVQPKKTF